MKDLYEIVKYQIQNLKESAEFISNSLLGYEKGLDTSWILKTKELLNIIRVEVSDQITEILCNEENKNKIDKYKIEHLQKHLDNYIKTKLYDFEKNLEDKFVKHCNLYKY